MLKHCHTLTRGQNSPGSGRLSAVNSPQIHNAMSASLSSLECSQSSGSEVSFDASFASTSSAGSTGLGSVSPLPRHRAAKMAVNSEMSRNSSACSSSNEPSSFLSTSSASPSGRSGQNGRVSIKVFASCLRPDIEYKTLCVSQATRAREVIWQLLSKFKMKHRDPKLFYLTMDVVINKNGGPVSRTLVLDEDSRPAELSLCNPWGECRFTLQMKKGGLVRIHDSVLCADSQYKSLLISEETTVEDVIRILLHCYNLETFPVQKFCVYEACSTQSYERKLNYEDRPLAVQDSWLDPEQFRLVIRRAPTLMAPVKPPTVPRGSMHQVGLPNVPVHSHALTDMGARAIQASLVERYSKFCQKYESYFYV